MPGLRSGRCTRAARGWRRRACASGGTVSLGALQCLPLRSQHRASCPRPDALPRDPVPGPSPPGVANISVDARGSGGDPAGRVSAATTGRASRAKDKRRTGAPGGTDSAAEARPTDMFARTARSAKPWAAFSFPPDATCEPRAAPAADGAHPLVPARLTLQEEAATLPFHLRRIALGIALLACAGGSLSAQAEHAPHMSGMAGMPERPFGIPMTRMGSGTAWLPDASAMRAWHFMAGRWMLMVHGDAFLQYDHQGGPRGDDQLGSINWGMLMAMRPLAGGTLHLHGMASAEPLTIGARGYPLLLQSGETYRGAAASRPAASARSLHGAVGALRAADQPAGSASWFTPPRSASRASGRWPTCTGLPRSTTRSLRWRTTGPTPPTSPMAC